MYWERLKKRLKSVEVAGLRAEILTRELPTTTQGAMNIVLQGPCKFLSCWQYRFSYSSIII
jgi:hypothetical protein